MVNAIERSRMIKPGATMLCLLGDHLVQARYAAIPTLRPVCCIRLQQIRPFESREQRVPASP
jgi:hypothetical protein